jgi:hypothetical protein
MNNDTEFKGRFFLITPEYPEKEFSRNLIALEKEIGFAPWRNDLWENQIPTLNQYGQLISRRSFFLISNSFSGSSQYQIRNSINVSNYSKASSLFGVKYIISNDPKMLFDDNVKLLKKIRINNEIYYFAELIKTNLGQFSPLKQNILKSFKSEKEFKRNIDKMVQNDFYTISDITNGVTLVKANNVRIKYKNNMYIVTAKSPATSVIILPIEYSNCFEFENLQTSSVFEVNWGLVGVIFNKSLDISIEYKNGLFHNPNCKLAIAE